MKKVIYILISGYCVISPFYLLNSGYPQISDVFLVAAFVLFMFNYTIKKDNILFVTMFILLLISIINMVWGLIYSTSSFSFSTIYYIFNFMLLIMVFNLYYHHGKSILRSLYKAIFMSIVLQVIISPVLINTGLSRQTLMFNNPNQLGYYSLLTFCILTLLFYILRTSLFQYFIISVVTIYLAFLSNSSSTILAILFILIFQLILIFLYRLNIKQKLFFILSIMVILLLAYISWEEITNIRVVENAVIRISGKEVTASDNLYERGYNRIFENPNLLVMGAGEGLTVERFGRGELHSTLVSFLFNYGIITMMFLIILFLLLIRKAAIIPLIILLSIHFYGLTHNGIRQPFFWLTNAVIFIGNGEGLFNFKVIINQMINSNKKTKDIF